MLFSIIAFAFYLGISPMPISVKAKKQVMTHLPLLKPNAQIFELGSGFGGMARILAKHYADQHVIAIEYSWIPFLYAKFVSQFFHRRSNLTYLRKDFRGIPLENADLVFCYLFPKAMNALEKKFQKELADNAIVMSNVFALPTWKAENIYLVNDLYHSKIYFYRKTSDNA